MNFHRIRNYIFPAILAVSFSIILLAGYHYSNIQKDDSLKLNLAGRQRMLSQRITKEILLYKIGELSSYHIINSMMIFKGTQYSLIKGGWAPVDIESENLRFLPETADKEVLDALIEVNKEWEPFEKNINQNIASGDIESLKYIISHNEKLLSKINDSVYALQLRSEKNNMIIRAIVIFSFIVIAAMLLINLMNRIKKLRIAAERIKELEILLPICSSCKKIRIDNDKPLDPESWTTIEKYLHEKNDLLFTHSICPDCVKKLYPDIMEDVKK